MGWDPKEVRGNWMRKRHNNPGRASMCQYSEMPLGDDFASFLYASNGLSLDD